MPKLADEAGDLLWRGDFLEIRAACEGETGQSRRMSGWTGWRRKGKGHFLAAAQILETTLRSGRPPAGRVEKVKMSTMGLRELRVTMKGSTPPHLRLLFVQVGHTLWAAHEFTKKSPDLHRSEIDAAESIASEWMARREAR